MVNSLKKIGKGLKNFGKILLVSIAYTLNTIFRTSPYENFQSRQYLDDSVQLLWKNDEEQQEWIEVRKNEREEKRVRCLAHPTMYECNDAPVLT